ncbi:IclR family transcriptional regulator [Arthrobacter ginkgonis]
MRALSLLECFGPGRSRLSLSQLARSSALPLSTAHRLVQDLAAWGALERDEDGRYRIGARLRQVASMADHDVPLSRHALPLMSDLAQRTGHTVLLAVLQGTGIVFLEHVIGSKAPFRPRPEPHLILTTAAGLLLSAHADAATLGRILEEHLPPAAPPGTSLPDAAALGRELARIRRDGHSSTSRSTHPYYTAVAAPIRTAPGAPVIAALSEVGVAAHADPRGRDAPMSPAACLAAAAGITAALSGS